MNDLIVTNGHGDGEPGRSEQSPPQQLGRLQQGPGQPGSGQRNEGQHDEGHYGLGQLEDHSSLEPIDNASAEAEDPGPRRPRPDEPGPEQARRWRFDRPAGRGARAYGVQQVAGPSGPGTTPGTAIVPSGHDWDERPGKPPGRSLLGFLWRRKLRIALVAAAAMACFTLAVNLIPPTYRASSAVLFQGDHPGATRDDDGQREPAFAADTLSNEIELLTSEELLGKVAATLDLTHDPEFGAGARFMPERLAAAFDAAGSWARQVRSRLDPGRPPVPSHAGQDDRLMETVDTLRSRLAIVPVGLSRVIRITAQAQDPNLAATLANAVAAAYADSRAEAKATATRDAHEWIEQRLNTLHERALRSASAYDAFRHENGAVRAKDGTISQDQVPQISGELTQARALRSTLQFTLDQVSGKGDADIDRLAPASDYALLARLREQLAVATARRAEIEAAGGSALANAVANRAQIADITRLIARERSRVRAALQDQLAAAQSNEQRLSAALDALKAKVDTADPGGAQMQALEREANADADAYRTFVSRAEQTDPEQTYQPPSVRILSRAVAPRHPASPNEWVILPGALLLALGIGTAAAFVTESRRRGVFTQRDLPRPDGQVPLGMLPLVRRGDRKMTQVWEEAVAQVLARILLPHRGIRPASILVTSALPREGKTRVAIALAAAARNRDARVLLVDADLRCRALSRAAGLGRSESNLVRLLAGAIDVDDAPTYHDGWGFAVLPAGELPDSPVNLLATQAWENALRDLEEYYDLVIIDTPPVLAAGDTWLMARHADATVVVAEWAITPAPAIKLAVEQLSSAHARVLGLVLTKVAPHEHASYGYDDSVLFSPKLLRYHRHRGVS